MRNAHNAHIIMMHGRMIVCYYIVLRISCPSHATLQPTWYAKNYPGSLAFSHDKAHSLENKNNRKTVELMEKSSCKSVVFCGFGTAVTSERECECECICRFIFQFVECCCLFCFFCRLVGFKNPSENRQSHTKNSSEWKMCNSLLLI